MHELDLAYSVLSVIERELCLQGFSKLKTVELEVGKFSGVDPDALDFSIKAILRSSAYSDAELKIVRKEAIYRCEDCKEHFTPSFRYSHCPLCNSRKVIIVQGDELKIKSLLIEKR